MKNKNITITKIHNELSFIPDNKLDEVMLYIESILNKTGIVEQKPVKLEGIWKGLGFENIENLDEEIQTLRKDMANSIEKKIP